MKTVYIMRGIPGSGKSTEARQLAGSGGVIHSTDDYFMSDGEYRFNVTDLPANHAKNFSSFTNSLRHGVSPIVVDNTNTKTWEYSRYVQQAKKFGYAVEIVEMPIISPELAASRNTHGVPRDVIAQMINRWQDTPDELL
jgi:predicted kinase